MINISHAANIDSSLLTNSPFTKCNFSVNPNLDNMKKDIRAVWGWEG